MTGLLIALLASSAPLDAAKKHLAAGANDDVLFALDGQKLPAAEKPEAAKVLTAAGRAVLEKDAVLALQFAQMALKLQPAVPDTLELASRASFAQQLFEAAEGYADDWLISEPKSAAAHLLRAELAVEAAEWDRALHHLDLAPKEARAAALRKKAEGAKADRSGALSTVRALEKTLAQAAEKSRRAPAGPAAASGAASAEVVLYGTSWCGPCRSTREWFTQKGISFTDHDIEKDKDAAQELKQKKSRQGVRNGGVPVTDVNGTLIIGFAPDQFEAALARGR